jgi:hypothetical protein
VLRDACDIEGPRAGRLIGCASAIKYLAKAILTGHASNLSKIFETSRSLEIVRGQLATERGIGQDIIVRFLADERVFNDGVVQHQLANLSSPATTRVRVGRSINHAGRHGSDLNPVAAKSSMSTIADLH